MFSGGAKLNSLPSALRNSGSFSPDSNRPIALTLLWPRTDKSPLRAVRFVPEQCEIDDALYVGDARFVLRDAHGHEQIIRSNLLRCGQLR